MMRSLGVVLLLACHLVAAPPKVPDPLKVAVGDDVVVEVQAEQGKVGAFREGFDIADCLFVRLYSSDESRMMFLCRPKRPGRFFVVFWSVGEAASSRLEIVAGGSGPKPPDGKPPVDPPPPTTGKLYFLIVRPDGPTSPEFARYMSQPGWTDLHGMGYSYKDATLTEARALNVTIPEGTPLPCVVTLRIDGDKATVARGPITIPAPDAITKLPEGVSK